MLSTLSLLLVTTALSVVMLLVLLSLAGSKVEGIRHWAQANALAILALLLFASRGVMPDLLSIEVANALFLATISLMYAGFRRYLGLPVARRVLAAGAVAAMAGVIVFHYVAESFALRTVSVSVYHSAVCFAIFATLAPAAERRLRYPVAFTRSAAFLLGVGHAWRGIYYLHDVFQPASLLDSSTHNLVFVAIGTLALPALTLGAVMMANAQVVAASAHAAEHDHLTGAPTRRAFFAACEREYARSQRHGNSLGLLLIDADHFKRINDSYGHAVGDEVLRDLVGQIRDTIRKIDHYARLGGEEFAVLLPDASLATAREVAERLRATLDRSAPAGPASAGVPYTVSIGLAILRPGENVAELMARADAALYAAKAGGRNQVACAEQAEAPRRRKVLDTS